jgi:RNA recognition motif-containing protein
MSVRLFVGNLPYDATEDEIRAHFATAGNLASVFVPVDRETGRKRGFAFVEYHDAAAAQEAIRLFNNQPFKGRALAVNEARAKEAGPRPPSPGGYRPGPPMGGRPSGPMGRPSGPMGGRPSGPPMHRGPAPDFMADQGGDRSRADRTRKFGPDAKPARVRAQRFKGPEGGKRAFKEKLGGQIFGDVTDEDAGQEPEQEQDQELDNFALGSGEGEDNQ